MEAKTFKLLIELKQVEALWNGLYVAPEFVNDKNSYATF